MIMRRNPKRHSFCSQRESDKEFLKWLLKQKPDKWTKIWIAQLKKKINGNPQQV
jgi:hypothetical protein